METRFVFHSGLFLAGMTDRESNPNKFPFVAISEIPGLNYGLRFGFWVYISYLWLILIRQLQRFRQILLCGHEGQSTSPL